MTIERSVQCSVSAEVGNRREMRRFERRHKGDTVLTSGATRSGRCGSSETGSLKLTIFQQFMWGTDVVEDAKAEVKHVLGDRFDQPRLPHGVVA